MRHYLNLHQEPFIAIKSGKKDIEMRLYDERRKVISVGDEIEFNNNQTNEKIIVDVVALHIFNNFEELYNAFPKERLGYLSNEVANPEDMGKYYPQELRDKYQVIGIEIKMK